MKRYLFTLLIVSVASAAAFTRLGAAEPKVGPAISPANLIEALRSGKLKLIDCSYTYFEGMPGIKLPPPFANTKTYESTNISRYDERGPAWYWNWFTVGEHAGTHVDAPNHWVSGKDNVGVDAIDLSGLVVPAVVINVEQKVAANPDYEVTREDVLAWEKQNGRVPDGAMVVMSSGWGKRWPDPAKFLGLDGQGRPHGPGFGETAAEFLIKERNISGLAVDTVSTEAMALAGGKKPMPFPVHFIAHGAKKYQIEMLANADKLPAKGAALIIAPIKVRNGSGAPARIFAIVEN